VSFPAPWRQVARRVRRTIQRRRPPTTAVEDPFSAHRPLDGPHLVTNPAVRHEPRRDDDPRLVVLLPHLEVDNMSGGPNTAFHVTARLAAAGIRLRYVATSGGLEREQERLRQHIATVTGVVLGEHDAEFAIASGQRTPLEVGLGDVLFATWWRTAHLANDALGHVAAREFLYLIQDYEPAFYPWSTRSAMVEATYRMPIRAIVNEPFLERYLRDARAGRFGTDAVAVATFLPAVDRDVFRRRSRPAGAPRRLVFYARPRNPRNLFELGLRALREAVADGVFSAEPWEFLAIGQELPDLMLSETAVLQGRAWLSYEDYGALLGSSDVMMSLMLSPHTSYPPLEMATAGGLVVTTTFGPKTAPALAAISPSLHGVEPDVASLVAGLRTVVGALGGAPDTSPPPPALPGSWDAALAETVPWLARQVHEIRGA
jgi:O-antigen biosynthesis protein